MAPSYTMARSRVTTSSYGRGEAHYRCFLSSGSRKHQYKEHSCSLRAAISAHNNSQKPENNTIYLSKDYQLDTPLPPITNPHWLIIQGTGTGRPAISGTCTDALKDPKTKECDDQHPVREFSVLRVAPTGALWLIDVTIKDGQASNGAGIYNEGSLMVYTSTVKSNHAHTNGGGIYNKGWTYIQPVFPLNPKRQQPVK